jgi:hypothetical protein
LPRASITWPEVEQRLDRIEGAIGSLAPLVGRHAAVPFEAHPHLAAIASECRDRRDAREAQKAERLREIEAERQAVIDGGEKVTAS